MMRLKIYINLCAFIQTLGSNQLNQAKQLQSISPEYNSYANSNHQEDSNKYKSKKKIIDMRLKKNHVNCFFGICLLNASLA